MFWNFSPGGTSSSKAQNQPFLQSQSYTPTGGAFGTDVICLEGLPAPPGVHPSKPADGSTRSVFHVGFRDGYAR